MKIVRVLICAVLFGFQPVPALCWRHGASGTATGASVVNINKASTTNSQSNLLYMNLAHTLSFGSSQTGWVGQLTANGYPTSGITSQIGPSNTLELIPTYYGHYKIWWSGTGAFQITQPIVIYSGGTSTALNTASGFGNNLAFGYSTASTQPTSASPIEFAFGASLSTISDAGTGACLTAGGTSGLICLTSTTAGIFGNFTTGSVTVNNITNLPSQAWTFTKLDSSHIQLQGSTYSASMSINSGAPGVQSEVIFSLNSSSWLFPAQGASSANYSGMDALVICRSQNSGWGGSNDCSAVASHSANPDYVSAFKALNPRFIRLMDPSGVTDGNYPTSYSYRSVPTNLQWQSSGNYVAANWAGLITNVSDTFTTASNPSGSPASGPPVDGEVVTGYISGANTTSVPKLIVNRTSYSSGVKILNSTATGLSLTMAGTVPGTGVVISLVFTGGGLASPFTYNYTTVAGDTSFSTIAGHIISDINSNATTLKNANIVAENPEQSNSNITFGYNPNINSSGVAALGNGLTITGSDSASSGVYDFGYINVGGLSNTDNFMFTYSAIAGGWIAKKFGQNAPGQANGTPLEVWEDLATAANVGLWWTVPILYSDTAVYNSVLHMANAGVKELVVEFANETWNTAGGGTWHQVQALGQDYGWQAAFVGGPSQGAYVGLRTIQIATQARLAWAAAGRSQSQLFVSNAYQFVNPSSAQTQQFNGAAITPGSNVTLAAYGGTPSNGTTTPGVWSTNNSTFPNRPIDWSDFASPAPYFNGSQFNSGNGSGTLNFTSVPLASYNCSLVASYNYVNGNPAEQSAALDFMFNGTTGDFYNQTGIVKGTFTATISSGLMNVSAILSGVNSITVGSFIFYAGSPAGLKVSSNGSGNGGTGTYNLSASVTVGSATTMSSNTFNSSAQLGSWAHSSLSGAADYFGITTIVAGYDSVRTGTNPHTGLPWQLLGVAAYEGDADAGPIQASDVTSLNTGLVGLGDVNGYTSGLGSSCGMTPHAGGPSSTIGTAAGSDASNMEQLLFAFKNDNRYNLLYLQYFNDFRAAIQSQGARMALPATYGFEGPGGLGGYWSKYPASIYTTPFQSVTALQSFR